MSSLSLFHNLCVLYVKYVDCWKPGITQFEINIKMTFQGAYSGVCEQPENNICVADAQVALPTRILMAVTQMQTSEVAATFVGERQTLETGCT